MASTYSNIKVQLMATGENTTTWGDVTNVNLGTALEEAIVGSADVAFSNANVTLTLTNTNSTQSARNVRLNLTGTATSGYNLVLGSGCQIDKPYIINNGTDGTITVKNTTGSGIAVPAGKTMWVFNNGTNVVDAVTHLTSLSTTGDLAVGANATFSGNVGIGTSAPGYPLSVKSAALVGAIRIIGRTADNIGTLEFIDTTQTTTQAYIQAGSTPYLAFATSVTERMRIDSAGLVGVGATAPKTRLQVTAAGFLNAPVLGSATGAPFYITNADPSYGLVVGINSADGRAFLQSQRTDGTASSGPITLNEAGGNVGIGVASPIAKLDVVGTVLARADNATGNSTLTATNTNTGNNTTKYSSLLLQGTDTVGTAKGTGLVLSGPSDADFVGSYMTFSTRSADALGERMRITSAGNVGIGTTNPSTALQVVGTVTATAFAGTASNATNLNGQAASYYTDIPARLGYTPVQQGGGAGQGSSKLYIGWLGASLGLQVDATNFGATWPIGITGNAATATTATTANALNTGLAYQINGLGVGVNPSGTAGEIRATNNVTAFFSSDAKLKENVQPIQNALGIVSAVGGKTFDWTDEYIAERGGEDGYFVRKSDFGVIAQDVQTVFPAAVREREDGTLAVDYEKLVAVAFQAIAELRAEVEALKK
jgi:hypothetical protein